MSKTYRSERKDKRKWGDILHEKKPYLERIQEETEAKAALADWERLLEEQRIEQGENK